MNECFDVFYVFWMYCMQLWLEIWRFCIKIRILQVWYWWTSLKRSSVRLSELHCRMALPVRSQVRLSELLSEPVRLELRLSELGQESMPGKPIFVHQYRLKHSLWIFNVRDIWK